MTTSPWSVKGISPETRAMAKDAARKSGMTIGAWINRAILRYTGGAPADPALAAGTAFPEQSPDTSPMPAPSAASERVADATLLREELEATESKLENQVLDISRRLEEQARWVHHLSKLNPAEAVPKQAPVPPPDFSAAVPNPGLEGEDDAPSLAAGGTEKEPDADWHDQPAAAEGLDKLLEEDPFGSEETGAGSSGDAPGPEPDDLFQEDLPEEPVEVSDLGNLKDIFAALDDDEPAAKTDDSDDMEQVDLDALREQLSSILSGEDDDEEELGANEDQPDAFFSDKPVETETIFEEPVETESIFEEPVETEPPSPAKSKTPTADPAVSDPSPARTERILDQSEPSVVLEHRPEPTRPAPHPSWTPPPETPVRLFAIDDEDQDLEDRSEADRDVIFLAGDRPRPSLAPVFETPGHTETSHTSPSRTSPSQAAPGRATPDHTAPDHAPPDHGAEKNTLSGERAGAHPDAVFSTDRPFESLPEETLPSSEVPPDDFEDPAPESTFPSFPEDPAEPMEEDEDDWPKREAPPPWSRPAFADEKEPIPAETGPDYHPFEEDQPGPNAFPPQPTAEHSFEQVLRGRQRYGRGRRKRPEPESRPNSTVLAAVLLLLVGSAGLAVLEWRYSWFRHWAGITAEDPEPLGEELDPAIAALFMEAEEGGPLENGNTGNDPSGPDAERPGAEDLPNPDLLLEKGLPPVAGRDVESLPLPSATGPTETGPTPIGAGALALRISTNTETNPIFLLSSETGMAGPAPSSAGSDALGPGNAGLPENPVALEDLTMMARAGNPGAQYRLGLRYAQGEGTPVNTVKAAQWIRRAARQNHVDAQYQMGSFYEKGQGVSANPSLAFGWYNKAASQGHAYAKNQLGRFFENGIGRPRQLDEARTAYEAAAAHGIPEAHMRLGALYEHGRGLPADPDKALQYYRQAAALGDPDAQRAIRRLSTASAEGPTEERRTARPTETRVSAARNPTQPPHATGSASASGDMSSERELVVAPSTNPPITDVSLPIRRNNVRITDAGTPSSPRPETETGTGTKPASTAPLTAQPDGRQLAPGDDIRHVQLLLTALGYDPGPLDGVNGPKTQQAIRRFQEKQGIPVTGTPTKTLLRSLKNGGIGSSS